MIMNTTCQIQKCVKRTPRGKPFTTYSLLKFGTRAAIDQALSRLATNGEIVRLTRGVYVRPEQNRFVGQVLPEPYKIAQVIAEKTNEVVQVSGAEAARQFGLSTQVPAQPIFLTSGQSRRFNMGSLEVTMKHVSKKKIPLSKSRIGLAISAIWYLGKEQATYQTIEAIKKKLSPKEFINFVSSTQYMPAWMSNLVLQYQKIQGIECA
jgi:hypothetical protein